MIIKYIEIKINNYIRLYCVYKYLNKNSNNIQDNRKG